MTKEDIKMTIELIEERMMRLHKMAHDLEESIIFLNENIKKEIMETNKILKEANNDSTEANQ